jgi:hypothetical protein
VARGRWVSWYDGATWTYPSFSATPTPHRSRQAPERAICVFGMGGDTAVWHGLEPNQVLVFPAGRPRLVLPLELDASQLLQAEQDEHE